MTPQPRLSILRTVGKGGFGIVYGCRTYYTGRMYAMKLCDKKHVKKGNAKHLCDNEHWALSLLDSPFTVNLKYAYQTSRALVLIIDLALGGDLKYWMEKKAKFDEPLAMVSHSHALPRHGMTAATCDPSSSTRAGLSSE